MKATKLTVCFLYLAALFLTPSCSNEYDDSELNGRVGNLESRVKNLEEQMKSNVTSLQTILTALNSNDYITKVTPITDGGKEIGYTIHFSKGEPIKIYHGKDGNNGQDGYTPQIGVKQYTDGIYYWTLNGQWMTDGSGNKIKAQGIDGQDGESGKDGQDGITPQFKIEDKFWWVSYDNGANWEKSGRATGEDAIPAFKEVTQDEDFVYFKMQDDTVISVPKHHPLSITFSETESIEVIPNQTYTISYTITGADENTTIKVLTQDGFRAVVKKTDHSKGVIKITTPGTALSSEILVLVTDGKEKTIMSSINFNFVKKVIIIAAKNHTVDYKGGTINIDLSTNINYTVEIPEADKSWISIVQSRTAMRDETVTFLVQPNEDATYRFSTIKFIDEQGAIKKTVLITQKPKITPKVINVQTPGTLKAMMTEYEKNNTKNLKITGSLNSSDFDFIKTMQNLSTLDLSELQNEFLPDECFFRTYISTIILPTVLKKIPNRAFAWSYITSINIPETVEEIGGYAFAETQSLTGNIVIPGYVVTIGNYAFQNSSFNGTLHIGESVQTIGDYAFSGCQGTGDIIIPDNVLTLGRSAFEDCRKFNGNLAIGNGVIFINDQAFQGCSELSGTLKLGNSITSIGENAFADCSSLRGNVDLPEGVTTIGERAFHNCFGFEGYLKLGPNIKIISANSFGGNASYNYIKLNFNRIYCMAINPPNLNRWSFGYYQSTINDSWPTHLVVPIGCKNKYENADYWKGFTTIEETDF